MIIRAVTVVIVNNTHIMKTFLGNKIIRCRVLFYFLLSGSKALEKALPKKARARSTV